MVHKMVKKTGTIIDSEGQRGWSLFGAQGLVDVEAVTVPKVPEGAI